MLKDSTLEKKVMGFLPKNSKVLSVELVDVPVSAGMRKTKKMTTIKYLLGDKVYFTQINASRWGN